MGIIHNNNTIEQQVAEVKIVKDILDQLFALLSMNGNHTIGDVIPSQKI